MRTEPQRITVEQFIALLVHIRGCRIATVHAETIPKLRQKISSDDPTLCPWFNVDSTPRDPDSRRWHIRKWTVFSVAMVSSRQAYENAVNARRAKEWQPLNADGTLQHHTSNSRLWGTRRKSAPLVDYDGKVYLDIQRLRILSYQFFDIRNGRTVTQSQLAPWLKVRKNESHAQQTTRPVVHRDYRIDRIRRCTGVNGQDYEIARQSRIKASPETRTQQIERRRMIRQASRNHQPRTRRRNAA